MHEPASVPEPKNSAFLPKRRQGQKRPTQPVLSKDNSEYIRRDFQTHLIIYSMKIKKHGLTFLFSKSLESNSFGRDVGVDRD